MAKHRYLIYADESDKKGAFYSNFFGGVLLAASDREEIIKLLDEKKTDLGLRSELKWQYVDAENTDRYAEFIRAYFTLIANQRLRVRIMFTQNRYAPTNLSSEQQKNSYFLLYYQFIKHAFGIAHNDHDPSDQVNFSVLFDKIPDSAKKANLFKDFIHGIEKTRGLRRRPIFLPREDIGEVDSSRHTILQGLDVILGSMCFRLNDKHLIKPPGSRIRGKRTRAKEKLYKTINAEIRVLYPNFNVGATTGKPNGRGDIWSHPYRHWLFIPKNYQVDTFMRKGATPTSPT